MSTPRQVSNADIYHVMARGTGRQIIFEDDEDRNAYLRILGSSLRKTSTELYAWCLMDNHIHLLLHAPLESISLCMKSTNGTYARYFNEKSGRSGHLFHERFRSEAIEDDVRLITVIRYIHANPQKAGIASTSLYFWSSYKEYLGEPGLCNIEFPLGVIGGITAFKTLHEQPLDESESILEIETVDKTVSDEEARKRAMHVIGNMSLDQLKTLPRERRDAKLVALKRSGLSIKQIERLTGIGRNTVQRAK